MTSRHFCTYFDHNYLPRAMVMLESLHEHCPHAHIHVLCLTDQCHTVLVSLAYPYVSLIRLADLESADPELAATRSTRSLIEYYFTITSCLPWYLLTRDDALEEVTYLDADMMFCSSPEPIFEEATGASVIITPHRFAANLKDRECYGLYNVSWLTFRQTKNGLKCLRWYRDVCLAWCKDILEINRFADQKYLDKFPYFPEVHVIKHEGAGVAPWNLADVTLKQCNARVYLNGYPMIFYHAHGFNRLWGPLFASGLSNYSVRIFSTSLLFLLKTYAKKLNSTEKIIQQISQIAFNGIRRNTKYSFYQLLEKIFSEYKSGTLIFLY